jgi:hypothetical protein
VASLGIHVTDGLKMFPAEPLLAITSHPPGPVTTPPIRIMAATGARIMPGLAGQILNYRGVKIVTGLADTTRVSSGVG